MFEADWYVLLMELFVQFDARRGSRWRGPKKRRVPVSTRKAVAVQGGGRLVLSAGKEGYSDGLAAAL